MPACLPLNALRQLHQELLTGEAVPLGNPGCPKARDWFRRRRFEAGQHFFYRYFVQCLQAFLLAIICGFNVRRLACPLLLTQRSNTPDKALRRYMATIRHLMLWFRADPFERDGPAQRSLLAVNGLHVNGAVMMAQHPGAFFTQYDMALVQFSFLCFVVLYPQQIGLPCSEEELLGYVHAWRVIGDCLGIQERWNLCRSEDLADVRARCKAIEAFVFIPAMEESPPDLQLLGNVFMEGFRKVIPFFPFSKASVLLFSLGVFRRASSWHVLDRPCGLKVTWGDRLRCLSHRCFMTLRFYFPWPTLVFSKLLTGLLRRRLGID